MQRKIGKVLKLFISKPQLKDRITLENLRVDQNGVIGDKFYAKDITRSVLLTSKDSYDLAKVNNIEINFGLLGENILMDFNPYSLDAGTRIKIGEAILEIAQNCTICNHLSVVDKKLPKLLKNDRGIFAKTIIDGTIKVGDEIFI